MELLIKILGAGKWAILLPFRLLIATLNMIPTKVPVWDYFRMSIGGVVTDSYERETPSRIHLGHLIVAWVQGSVQRVELYDLEHIKGTNGEDDRAEVKSKYTKRAINRRDYDSIRFNCRIW